MTKRPYFKEKITHCAIVMVVRGNYQNTDTVRKCQRPFCLPMLEGC